MASNTENLGLLKKNPSTDGADTFNIQTMLNDNWDKLDANAGTVAQTLANILKPTTPPVIGLPPSTTPDEMFQALGNTGELHVWRKTEKVGSKGYYLDSVSSGRLSFVKNGAYVVTFSYSDTVSPNGALSGTVNTVSLTGTGDQTSKLSALRGKFCRAESSGGSDSAFAGIIYIPNDATFTYKMEGLDYYSHYVDKKQTVVFTDAPTATTYPVSTNPNAYQEGDDAKPAGYVLGDVVTGKFAVSFHNAAEGYYYKVSGNIDVSSSGSVSMPSTSENVLIDYSHNNSTTAVKNKFAGKFVQFLYRNGGDGRKFPDTKPPFNGYDIVYIPDNVSVTQEKVISDNDFVVDRYQPVTGYAAIPAGTTIEYLGKLGDKARVQVVSYVGTGTSGSDNPVSITFDFVPKSIWVIGMGYSYKAEAHLMHGDASKNSGDVYYFAFTRISWKNKTVSWYNERSDGGQASALQANILGETYKVLAIG